MVGSTNGYKILFLAPLNGMSHWLFMRHLVEALLNRQHEVTFITSNTWGDIKPPNYTEILIDPPFDVEKIFPQTKVFEAESGSDFASLVFLPILGKATAEHALKSFNVQKFIHDDSFSFDLVINEEFFMESFSMFAHKFKAPLLTVCKFTKRKIKNGQLFMNSFLTSYIWVLSIL